ncbi:hypothetical protein CR513_35926, partial [Mucuna pruriens]
MRDGWTNGKGRSLTNFLINSPSESVFLKSIDTSDVINDDKKMFELLDIIVEEIGEENVVQVMTDGASNLVATGRMLMEKKTKLFWSPCVDHCLDLVLEDIEELPVFYNTIANAKKSLPTYIGLHGQYSKGRELTRFATSYLTLNCIKQQKNALRSMFASEEWATSSHASKSEAKQVMNLVLSDGRFWKSITYCLKCVIPLEKC